MCHAGLFKYLLAERFSRRRALQLFPRWEIHHERDCSVLLDCFRKPLQDRGIDRDQRVSETSP